MDLPPLWDLPSQAQSWPSQASITSLQWHQGRVVWASPPQQVLCCASQSLCLLCMAQSAHLGSTCAQSILLWPWPNTTSRGLASWMLTSTALNTSHDASQRQTCQRPRWAPFQDVAQSGGYPALRHAMCSAEGKMVPPESHGVRCMSMGLLMQVSMHVSSVMSACPPACCLGPAADVQAGC